MSPAPELPPTLRHDLRGHCNSLRLNHEVVHRALARGDVEAAARALERARSTLTALETALDPLVAGGGGGAAEHPSPPTAAASNEGDES